MIKVFSTAFRVTQTFGGNFEYYKQFGLIGHEGLDLVPTGVDRSVYSLPFKGKVVKDIDMADKGGAYGVHCTVWYPEIKEAWMYCHLASNTVYVDQELDPGYYLGQMGGTGNTQGDHLHLNRFRVDVNGIRLDKNNGYLGGVDPLPFLQQDLTPPTPQPLTSLLDDEKRALQVLKDAFPRLKTTTGEAFGNLEGMTRELVDKYPLFASMQGQIALLQAANKNVGTTPPVVVSTNPIANYSQPNSFWSWLSKLLGR